MKKSLVLAMAMALGVTASAYAANPFTDVPAGHWAYDHIDKLFAAGIIEGNGDGTYQGDRTMTRYEMAKVVAVAMAKGANVDKLAAEFADELDNLGVRVAKLEKKADNVTITGQIRYENVDEGGSMNGVKDHHNIHRLRTRLFVNGQINENWAYHARLENNQKFNNKAADNSFDMNQAYVTGKLGGLKVSAGRTPLAFAQSVVWDDNFEGVEVKYGKKVQLQAWAGQNTEDKVTVGKKVVDGKEVDDVKQSNHMYGATLSTKIGVVAAEAGLARWTDRFGDSVDSKIGHIALATPVTKSIKASAVYVRGSEVNKDADKDGFTIGLNYKGAKAAKVGSWGLNAKYLHFGANNVVINADRADGDYSKYDLEGFKGYTAGVDYAVAKNMVASVQYTDIKGALSDKKSKELWSRLQLSF